MISRPAVSAVAQRVYSPTSKLRPTVPVLLSRAPKHSFANHKEPLPRFVSSLNYIDPLQGLMTGAQLTRQTEDLKDGRERLRLEIDGLNQVRNHPVIAP